MIGERIRKYRKSKDLTLKKLGEILGISQASLSEIENEKSKPSADTIEAFLRNTEINIEWLLLGNGSIEKEKYNKNYPTSGSMVKEERTPYSGVGNNNSILTEVFLKALHIVSAIPGAEGIFLECFYQAQKKIAEIYGSEILGKAVNQSVAIEEDLKKERMAG